jgi:hypothetical protein
MTHSTPKGYTKYGDYTPPEASGVTVVMSDSFKSIKFDLCIVFITPEASLQLGVDGCHRVCIKTA